MTDEKMLQIRTILLAEWDNYPNKVDLINMILDGFVFGKYAHSEHYLIDDIIPIVQEIEIEKIPITDEDEGETII